MQNVELGTLLLMLVSAGAYVAATYFMKLFATHQVFWISALIALTLLIGVICELVVLRDEKMGHVYFVIVGLECVLVAAFAKLALNENYSVPEITGLVLIVAGVAVLQLPDNFLAKSNTARAQTVISAKNDLHTARQVPVRSGKSNKSSAAL